eukprot:767218-Hanusia_phi.AAC.2
MRSDLTERSTATSEQEEGKGGEGRRGEGRGGGGERRRESLVMELKRCKSRLSEAEDHLNLTLARERAKNLQLEVSWRRREEGG